jgi:hypothetical protein
MSLAIEAFEMLLAGWGIRLAASCQGGVINDHDCWGEVEQGHGEH